MSLTPGTGRPTLGDDTNRGVFFRMATDPVVRLWTGRDRIRVAANDLDPAPSIYDGLGVLRSLPEIDRLVNGAARRITVAISGLDHEAASLIDDDAVGMDGVRARLSYMRYDRAWRPMGELNGVWDGLIDEISLDQTQNDKGEEWTLTISMSSAFVERNKPILDLWTPKSQGVISPTDQFFEFIPSLDEGTTRLYPPR